MAQVGCHKFGSLLHMAHFTDTLSFDNHALYEKSSEVWQET